MTLKAPELLLPAGSLDKMRAAYDFGADAVYAGQPRYSLRARNNEFRLEQIAQGIRGACARQEVLPDQQLIAHNDKVRTYLRDIEPIIAMKPDALIMADPGLIMMVKEKWPEAVIHLSVQANTTNYATVKFWQKMGVSRIILSRELSLDEIEKIRQECPDMELEVFVHGALCIAYSGRCLLSATSTAATPTRAPAPTPAAGTTRRMTRPWTPTPARPWPRPWTRASTSKTPRTTPTTSSPAPAVTAAPPQGRCHLPAREKGRPGEMMPIMEDEHGTYIMNSKDLRAVEHVERLTKIGVDSLKIEGRTKSLYYVARTAQTYRRAIDDAVAGRPFNPHLITELEGLANRGYTGGLLERRPANDYQNYETGTACCSAATSWARCAATPTAWPRLKP
jgi:putative protease